MLTQWDWKPIPFSNAVPHVYTKIAGTSLYPLRGDQRQGISHAFADGRSEAWSFSACRNAYTNKQRNRIAAALHPALRRSSGGQRPEEIRRQVRQ
jgi:hypothetical protein